MTDHQPIMPTPSDGPTDAERTARDHARHMAAWPPPPQSAGRPTIRCGTCQSVIFDGLVIKSRVVRVLPRGAEAKCRCKTWVPVPVTYSE